MSKTDTAESPLETVTEAAGPNATEAFSILGNETRLAILITLWDELDPFAKDPTDYMAGAAVPFSELRRRVGVRDPGQFHYHIDQLVGRFVHKSDDGYELNAAGKEVVRTVIATVGFDQQSTEPSEIDDPCPFCGAPTEVMYRNYRLYQVCTECDGMYSLDDHPEGIIVGWKSSPALINHGSAERMYYASRREAAHLYALRYEGVCARCSGPITRSVHICEDHNPQDGASCPTCDREFEVAGRFVCDVCKEGNICPVLKAVLVPHHRVIDEFLVSHGVLPEFPYLTKVPWLETEESVISMDPIRVRVTLAVEDDELELLVDEDINVVEAAG